jgi:hypothetical protein
LFRLFYQTGWPMPFPPERCRAASSDGNDTDNGTGTDTGYDSSDGLSQVGDDADADVSSNLAQAAEADAAEASSNINDANACLSNVDGDVDGASIGGWVCRTLYDPVTGIRFDRSVPFPKLRSSRTSVAVATITVTNSCPTPQEQRQQRCACPSTGNGGGSGEVVCWYRSSSSRRHRRRHHHRQVAMIAACDGRGGRPNRQLWRPLFVRDDVLRKRSNPRGDDNQRTQ